MALTSSQLVEAYGILNNESIPKTVRVNNFYQYLIDHGESYGRLESDSIIRRCV